MKRILFLLLLTCLVISACQPLPETGAAVVVGKILIQRHGSRDFVQLHTFQSVKAGEALQAADSSSYGEFGLVYGYFVLLPDSQVTLLDIQTTEQADLKASLRLDYGSVFVESGQSTGKISLEVLTDYGTAALHGSSMVVTQDSNNAKVYCLSGSATATGSSTVSLMAGQSSTMMSIGSAPTPPQTDPYYLQSKDPSLQEVINDRYLHYGIEDRSTFTPEPTSTATHTPVVTRTALATWTPFALGPTSTPRVDSAVPTYRPTITLPAGFTGLTAEEQAAQGTHTYSVACQSWGDCVCDSALAEPRVTIPVVFDTTQVTLGSGNESLTYPKVWPNLYRLVLQGKVAEIRFLPEGFEFFVTQAGQACSLQTFTRQP